MDNAEARVSEPPWWATLPESERARRCMSRKGRGAVSRGLCLECGADHSIQDCGDLSPYDTSFLWQEYKETIFGRTLTGPPPAGQRESQDDNNATCVLSPGRITLYVDHNVIKRSDWSAGRQRPRQTLPQERG